MSSNTMTQAQPLTAMTTWERDAAEQARYRELDQCSAWPETEMEAGQ